MDRTPGRIAVVVALGLTAMAISIPVAQAGLRPDDRPVRGDGRRGGRRRSRTRPQPAPMTAASACVAVDVVGRSRTRPQPAPMTARPAASLRLMVPTVPLYVAPSVVATAPRVAPAGRSRICMDGGRARREHHACPPLRACRGGSYWSHVSAGLRCTNT